MSDFQGENWVELFSSNPHIRIKWRKVKIISRLTTRETRKKSSPKENSKIRRCEKEKDNEKLIWACEEVCEEKVSSYLILGKESSQYARCPSQTQVCFDFQSSPNVTQTWRKRKVKNLNSVCKLNEEKRKWFSYFLVCLMLRKMCLCFQIYSYLLEWEL